MGVTASHTNTRGGKQTFAAYRLGCWAVFRFIEPNYLTCQLFFEKMPLISVCVYLKIFAVDQKKIRDGNTFFTFMWKSLLENFGGMLKDS